MIRDKQKKQKTGIEKKQDFLENQVKYSFIAIGSNLGNKKNNIEKTKYLLKKYRIEIIKSSSIYETYAWPNRNDPKFYNLVLKIKTKLNPVKLFKILKNIEKHLGRKKSIKNSPRVCDIDIIDYNGINFKNSFLEIPHPEMRKRDFVLLPLMEVCNNWIYPGLNIKISSLINKISKNSFTSIKII